MIIENIELDINLNTNSVKEYTDELLYQLEILCDEMNTVAIDPCVQNSLEAKKEMLINIMKYINKNDNDKN